MRLLACVCFFFKDVDVLLETRATPTLLGCRAAGGVDDLLASLEAGFKNRMSVFVLCVCVGAR